jgi:hypothetical protein
MANEPKTPPSGADRITFEQFTESTVGAVLRAAQAHKLPHAPIIIGIIWNPEGLPAAPEPVARPK